MLIIVGQQRVYSSLIYLSLQLEIAETLPSAPSSGYLAVNVDVSPSCEIYTDDRAMQATSSSIAEKLEG